MRAGFFTATSTHRKPDEFYGFGDSANTCDKCCECPKGETYRMKGSLTSNHCDIQNCIHGKLIDCISAKPSIFGNPSLIHDSVYCSPVYSEIPDGLFINPGMGGKYGGRCMCPDGFVYWAGNPDPTDPTQLACENDLDDTRHEHKKTWPFLGRWSYKSLKCQPRAPDGSGPTRQANNILTGHDLPGTNGGLCKCPGGQVYPVGDRWNDCGTLDQEYSQKGVENSLVCVGGQIFKDCEIDTTGHSDWKYKGVVCDNRQVPEFYYKEVLDRFSSEKSLEFGFWAGMVTAEGDNGAGDGV
jgi:hypothetical protein